MSAECFDGTCTDPALAVVAWADERGERGYCLRHALLASYLLCGLVIGLDFT